MTKNINFTKLLKHLEQVPWIEKCILPLEYLISTRESKKAGESSLEKLDLTKTKSQTFILIKAAR